MTDPSRKTDDLEHDFRAELGLKDPVRDQERLGDTKYSVTPPRNEVRAPEQSEADTVTCSACRKELDPRRSYRADGDEYVYHFCGVGCYDRWNRERGQGARSTSK